MLYSEVYICMPLKTTYSNDRGRITRSDKKMTWPRYAISQSEAQLALIISYNSYKPVNLWVKLGLVFYFKSLLLPEIDVKTGWGVNFSFGQDGGGGGGGRGLSKNFV